MHQPGEAYDDLIQISEEPRMGMTISQTGQIGPKCRFMQARYKVSVILNACSLGMLPYQDVQNRVR